MIKRFIQAVSDRPLALLNYKNKGSTIVQKQPVFVCGLSRSGTSWLANSITQSEELVYLKETWLLRQLKDLADWQGVLYREWDEFTPWRESSIDPAKFYKHMGEFYHGLLNEMSENQRFLEKTPVWNLLFFDTLKKMFPDAYFIFLYRDGRNYVASAEVKAKKENKPFDFDQSCHRWVESMRIIDNLPKTTPENKVKIVRYEELISDFQAIFLSVCQFIEISPFKPGSVTVNSSFNKASCSEDFNYRWKMWSDEKNARFMQIAGQQLNEWRYLD